MPSDEEVEASQPPASSPPVVTAALLIIGDEILSGRTRDANLSFLGEKLNEIGIRMTECRVVPDRQAHIVAALNALRATYDHVFTTGGIGPTHDDITAEAVAVAFGRPLIVNPEARRILEGYYPPGDLTPARLRMARTPEGARLIANPVSAAPGFQVENVYVMAGIPRIMQAMFAELAPSLKGGQPLLSRTVTAHLPESRIAPGLEALLAAHPDLEAGSYPFERDGRPGTNLVLRSTDPAALERGEAALREVIAEVAASNAKT